MTAPALVMLGHGHDEPSVQQMATALRRRLQQLRPALSVHVSFIDKPDHLRLLADQLVAEGRMEAACIPLDLSRAVDPDEPTLASIEALRQSHPSLRVGISRPIGPGTPLLNVLDERLRTALRATHTVELDGLVLSLPRGGDVRGNALVSRRARQWSNHHHLPVVVAVGDGSGPSVVSAISSLRGQGRRHIAVGSFFIAEDEGYRFMAEMAVTTGASAVGGPIGPDDRLLELVMARYSYAAMELLDMPDFDTPETGEADNFDLDESV